MNWLKDQDIPFQKMMKISADALKSYARGSLDPNPIHLDEEAAKKVGLKSVIAHGMLIAGLITSRVEELLGEEGSEDWMISNLQFRFKAMTYNGENISVGGKVGEIVEGESIELLLKAQNDDQEIKTLATVTLSARAG